MSVITIKKSFADKVEEAVLVKMNAAPAHNFREELMRGDDTLCFVLDRGMSDALLPIVLRGTAPRYIIVPKIEEEKHRRLAGRALVHEVPDVKGNYCLKGREELYLLDPNTLYGTKITDRETVAAVRGLFMREFWLFTEREFIERVEPMAEVSFDVPAVNTTPALRLDESFGEQTPVASLLDGASAVAFTGRADVTADTTVIIKDVAQNAAYLKTAGERTVLLCPQLAFSAVCTREGKWYALSFDAADYPRNLPTAGKGRLFAVELEAAAVGETYTLKRNARREELAGLELLTMEGEPFSVADEHTEERTVSVDLRVARVIESAADDVREAYLEKLDGGIFASRVPACRVTYRVELALSGRTITKEAEVYAAWERAKGDLLKRVRALLRLPEERIGEHKRPLSDLEGKIEAIAWVEDFEKAATELNAVIEALNKDKKGVAYSLYEVPKLLALPVCGTLYQAKDKYEYALRDASFLDEAIKEMEEMGIDQQKVKYLLA